MIVINIPAKFIPQLSRRTWLIIGSVAALLVLCIAWYVYTTNAWTAETVEDAAYREALIAQEEAIRAERDRSPGTVTYGECVLLKRSLFGIFTQRYYVMPYAYLNTHDVPAAGQVSWWTEMGVVCVDEKRGPTSLPGGLSVTDCTVTMQSEDDKIEFSDSFLHSALSYVDGIQQKSVTIRSGDFRRNVFTFERFPLRAPSVVDLSVGVSTAEEKKGAYNVTIPVSAVWQYDVASRFDRSVVGGKLEMPAEVVYNYRPL